MNEHDITIFVDKDGNSLETDLCYFCARMESPDYHGKCPHFSTDYVGNKCPASVSVSDVSQRIKELVAYQKNGMLR